MTCSSPRPLFVAQPLQSVLSDTAETVTLMRALDRIAARGSANSETGDLAAVSLVALDSTEKGLEVLTRSMARNLEVRSIAVDAVTRMMLA